jgi:phenylacetate-coenzyme A ligase PaaK-like adenylate-forming protein
MSLTATSTSFEQLRDRVNERLLDRMDDRIDRLDWSAERIEGHQTGQLRALLAHAIERSPFHRRRLAGIDPAQFDLCELPKLPVMTKADMMRDLDDVFTDRRITADAVERALATTGAQPVPIENDFVAMSTGGSSGVRGVFAFDETAMPEFIAAIVRSLIKRLRALGGPPPGGLAIAMVAAGSATHATGSAQAWTENSDLPLRMRAVPVTLPLAEIVSRLNALDAPALFGYPSMLARLAAERRAGRLRAAPLAVSSTSETLLPELREVITEGFDVPVVDTFGSTEGLIGTSAPGSDVLVFNSDMCIVELVDETNEPVPPGVASAKVLVTNLYNRVQPLIRYELTDSFVRVVDPEADGHLRAKVQGRSDDVLHYDDAEIHPLVVRSVMCKTPEVADYQVRQTRRGIDVFALPARPIDRERLHIQLSTALTDAGLTRPEVTVHEVATLPAHPETGKLRRFVPM